MNIPGTVDNEIINYVFSGYYFKTINKGSKGRLFQFSSPSFSFSGFPVPYDAKLNNPSGNIITAAAQRIRNLSSYPIYTDRSGVLYYNDNATIYGLCHGFGEDEDTYYNGFNYYNAFYPGGYFSPSFGENISIFKANTDGYSNLNNGACGPLNVTEYNEQFGVVSKSATDVNQTTDTLTPNIYAPIYSPKETCPPSIAVTNYYDEINFENIQGNSTQLGAGVFYNNNPIPTSLDNYDIKLNGRYQISGSSNTNTIFFSGGRPISSYNPNNQLNKLNNPLCQASLMETSVSIGRGVNQQQLLETPDLQVSSIGSQVSFIGADPYHYWHFTFRENADSLPFSNYFTQISPGSNGSLSSHRSISQGTLLFLPVLSSDEYYWQNRQCPDTVDYLPWTFGASIYACPSQHFDIPYYAATRKFGFYGARFLNNCNTLNLQYPINGVENATEVQTGTGPLVLDKSELEPEDLDKDGSWAFSSYDNLLRIAGAEEKYSNMYALNKGFFIWANSQYITGQTEFSVLNNQYIGFSGLYLGLIQSFNNVFSGGLSSFSGSEPQIIITDNGNSLAPIETGLNSEILFTNDVYIDFKNKLNEIVTGNGIYNWNAIENQFAYYISNGSGVNEDFYNKIVSGREKRLLTRYFENIVRGNPIDLFPLNHISFSFDKAKDYHENINWSRTTTTIGQNSNLPEINKRYFEGAYGNSSAINNLVDVLDKLSFNSNTSFYPGFFNDIKQGTTLPKPTYIPTQSGFILDNVGRKYSPSGWLALGYNEVGILDNNFSCFTPIFTQNPTPQTFCKIGQRPTLRVTAVDYHSIPEDKINIRYPEIIYWCQKLKILGADGKNLYPLKYKWNRVLKTDYDDFINNGDFSKCQESNPTGEWCAFEGDGPSCTLIHPNECSPVYNTGNLNIDNYSFIKGAKFGIDDNYYYFCLTSGRFGVRISNKTELMIENWLKFDISYKNASNLPLDLSINFQINDKNGQDQTVNIPSDFSAPPAYYGYEADPNAIPESAVQERIPPPNAGYGDVTAFRFIGSVGYVGATRSYMPSTLFDTRGLTESWGRLLDYGSLISFSKFVSQNEGDLLYGYHHLPFCQNYSMPNGRKGVIVSAMCGGKKISHWTLPQQAFAALDSSIGMKYTTINNIGQLYPPINTAVDIPNKGIGHWQWGNNLGAIKRFGYLSKSSDGDITFNSQGDNLTDDIISIIKKQVIRPTDLAGANCGYTKYGLGRNMLYYLEAYNRFYLICDPIKKKNVSNISFMCPGLRQANSAIQYSWLGNPSNTYVERRPMYGPYAYQWRVRRHNRDRNGNGISEGYYSMGWDSPYSLLYDAPAVYGMYVHTSRDGGNLSTVNQVNSARSQAQLTDLAQLRSMWFGVKGSDGTSSQYGTVSFSCDPTSNFYNSGMCNYLSLGQFLANTPDFNSYSCPEQYLSQGVCFDPCLSLRYAQGFFPGGKAQDLFSYNTVNSSNLPVRKSIRLVSTANFDTNNSLITIDEQSTTNPNIYFRSPINTPHSRIWRQLGFIQNSITNNSTVIGGVSPCKDGGADHCNYNTPTIHLGSSSTLVGETTTFFNMLTSLANLYSPINIFGANE